MILQVKDIVTGALSLIGVTEIDETPTSSEMGLAIRVANSMLARWATSRLVIRSTKTLVFNTVPDKSTYTVSTAIGSDIINTKPLNVVSCFMRDGSHDYQVVPQSIAFYNALPNKLLSKAVPEYIIYEPGLSQQTVQTGEFIFYPIPNKVYSANVEVDCYLSDLVNPTDTLTFEDMYYEPLTYNLAVRLYRHFRTGAGPIPEDIVGLANSSLRMIKTVNHSLPTATIDVPSSQSGGYNIYTDR